MKFTRMFTASNKPVEAQIQWKTVESKILNADGSVVFHMPEVEVPSHWSQTATDILAQKYFRKAGVPQRGNQDLATADESGIPGWLQPLVQYKGAVLGPETSAKQVFHRLAGCWTYWGWREGYFKLRGNADIADEETSARIFYDEIYWILAMQYAAPNSPQWFNCFSGNEKLLTKEYGVVPLAEVVGEQVSVWAKGSWHEAKINSYGKQKLQRVTFVPVYWKNDDYRPCWMPGKTNHRVYTDVTPNHRWILENDKETTNLVRGNIVKASITKPNMESNEYRRGFRHGVIFGDGNVAYRFKTENLIRYRARLCGEKKYLIWAFDHIGYPECFGGDPLVHVTSSKNLKEFPVETDSDYLGGFLDGWIATDGSKRDSSIRLSTRRPDADRWMEEHAALAGWLFTGSSIDNSRGGYDVDGPQYVCTLTQDKRAWKVIGVELLEEEEEVFCANVPDVKEFTLASGLLTGNCGLFWAYGIAGPDSGQWTVNPRTAMPERILDSYSRPQTSACFIQPVADDLVNPGGIMDLWTREVRLFKHGSGTGTNFSSIRGKDEPLSGGGKSSGLMSFLRIGDTAAGAIKSGGVTRRAAKMVVVDLDHPEIEEFITWKVTEDKKARALVASGWSEDAAVETISGQNSNNSVRVTDKFLERVDQKGEWDLIWRTDPSEGEAVDATKLWESICHAAHSCGDPGVQFHDTIQKWNTCKNDGAINATNPCSEYIFLDNTPCNLASLNLAKLDTATEFNTKAFSYVVRLWTTVLDISVSMSSYPSAEIALGAHNYRTLGLGYANLGGMLMRRGIAYDSDEGRFWAKEITTSMHATALKTSAEMADELGPFPRWKANREPMLGIIEQHGLALQMAQYDSYRNAQVTVIAPTGTIALLMDCDTTGIEPAFALATHKKLAGGGSITATSWAVLDGLLKLGYTPAQVHQVARWIEKGGELADMPPRNGGPFIDLEHLPVFATAVGKNALSPEAHVKMVAAVQPYLSGGVSKTVNMPESATVEDVDRIYRLAHKLGLKSISIYRDKSKVEQPLSARADLLEIDNEEPVTLRGWTPEERAHWHTAMSLDTGKQKQPRGTRIPLPTRRSGYAHKLRVDGRSLYLHTGEYPDGVLGEIFINLNREGSTLRSIMECFAKAVSIGIQYGVPLDEFVKAFVHTKFEPAGIVQGHETIRMCSSIVDLIFRDLELNYLHANRVHSKFPADDGSNIPYAPDLPLTEMLSPATSKGEPIKWGNVDICWDCGNATLIRTGSCLQCTNCGANSGCG